METKPTIDQSRLRSLLEQAENLAVKCERQAEKVSTLRKEWQRLQADFERRSKSDAGFAPTYDDNGTIAQARRTDAQAAVAQARAALDQAQQKLSDLSAKSSLMNHLADAGVEYARKIDQLDGQLIREFSL